ncbi:hypothetical protein JNUCC0626_37870 [Lentzea sp. JNUCC 0626]|uniref:hypothetical protein n=1 Tax=Lentzea sp. JNUCC 0626 TaxID=3367513 RepID=UPI003749B13D
MDEMDLMKKLSDVPSPSPEAYDRARAALQTAMTETETPENAVVVRPRRWSFWSKAGVTAVGAAAVATAVVMGTTGGTTPTVAPDVQAAAPVVESPLVKLASQVASQVKASAPLPGDASMVIGTKTAPDGSPYLHYTVYSDKGEVFKGDSPQTLRNSVAKKDDGATQYDKNVMAAARQAATGDVEKARIAMLTAAGNSLGLGLSPADADKAWAEAEAKLQKELGDMGKKLPGPRPRPTGEELETLLSNHLWSSSTYALFVGAANPDVRAGVLKLLATIKQVTVGEAVIDGQRALTISATPEILGGDASAVLSINAENGLPIRDEVFPNPNSATPSKQAMVTYQSSRVTLANVAAGVI